MEIKIVLNGADYVVNPERINMDERLDEALDSVKFCFISKEIKTDIPPFTIAVITDGNIKQYYYCSTSCDAIVEMPGYYYHTAQLVEATKILETFVIGTKAFSVIEGKSNYNEGRHRLEILNNLVKKDYGYTIELSGYLTNYLTDKRAYSFGAGTTYYDIALEICKVQNCLPFISNISDDGKTLTLDIQSLNLKTDKIEEIEVYSVVSKNQSVDEYCSNVITEMDSVVDRNTITTCIITPRSTSDTIYIDNAVLRLPSNCESVKYLYGWMYGFNGPTCKIPASWLNFNDEPTYDKDANLTVKLIQWIERYSANDTIESLLKNWINIVSAELGYGSDYYDQAIIYWQYNDYCLLLLWKSDQYSNIYYEDWLSIGLLNKEQWSLLTTDEQPAFIYYDTDINVIDGFRNYKNNDFWNSMIWGSSGPFLNEFFKDSTDKNYIRTLKYVDFDQKANTTYTYNVYSLNYTMNYHIYNSSNNPSSNILDYRWKVEYIAKPHIGAIQYKSIEPENETSWKKTTRSYNNGASTVDFNQLIPAMNRSANMFGLETTSVESLEEHSVGKRTQFGYIVSKQSNFNLYNGKKVINNIVYNCCQNYHQIAQAIGIDTQYEATNVPSTGIVTRYITIEKKINSSLFNQIIDEANIAYFLFAFNDNNILSKPCTKLAYDDTIYLICETEDNYTFDYAKTDSNTPDYYKREPVAYADKDQCITYGKVCLSLDDGYGYIERYNSQYDALPRYMFGEQLFSVDNIYIGKDARERLIFQYKLIKQ